MKKIKHLFTALLLLCATVVSAHDITIDGVYYNIIGDNDELEVTYYGDDCYNVPEAYKYQGDLTISKKVVHGGVIFTVTSIGDYAFQYCSGLTSITIPNSVTSIGYYAFNGCSGLTSITIPNSVTSIGDFAFQACFGLTSITIPNSVTSIGFEAFYSCDGLTSITIPNSVTSIGNRAFYYCSGLESIVVDPGNTKYDSRDNCNAIIETATNTLIFGCWKTTVPDTITAIGAHAFFGNTNLSSINLPESIVSIGEAAFNGCEGLSSIVIPSGVTEIKPYTFSNCRIIKTIDIRGNVTVIGEGAFNATIYLEKIILPASVTKIYENAFTNAFGKIYFRGSEAQWAQIEGHDLPEMLAYSVNGRVIYNYDGE